MSLINDLKRNLVNAEELGDTEWAKALKTRIADEEKAAAKAEAPAPAKAPAKKAPAKTKGK